MDGVELETSSAPAQAALDLAIVYRRERAFVRTALLGLGVPRSAVDDAIHDVFLVVFRRLADYDRGRGTLRAWLFGIAVRVAARGRRRSTRAAAFAAVEIDPPRLADPERYVAALGAAELADRLIAAIPSEQWIPFVLAEVEGLRAPEIAELLGIQTATVYTRIHRARARLERVRRTLADDERRPWWAMLFGPPASPSRTSLMAAFVSMRVAIGLALGALAIGAILLADRRAELAAATTDAQATGDGAMGAPADRRRTSVDGPEAAARRTPASIGGTVRTPTGVIAGAEVCAWPRPHLLATMQAPIACAQTDTAGRYVIRGLPAGGLAVTANAPAWAPTSYRPAAGDAALALAPGEHRAGVDLVLDEPGTTLTVRVSDLLGGPVEGAMVVVGDPSGGSTEAWHARPPAVGRSDAAGEVTLASRRGGVVVRARADGYATATHDAIAPGPVLELVLAPASSIAGRVVDGETGDPIAGALVQTRAEHDGWRDVATDDAGRFRIGELAPGEYRLRARGDGRYGEHPGRLVLGLAEHVGDVVIETTRAGSLQVEVVLAGGTGPCRSGAVALLVDGSAAELATLDGDGRAELTAVAPGSYRPHVFCDHAAPRADYPTIVVDDASARSVTLEVDAGATLRGHVRATDGAAVARASVLVQGGDPGNAAIIRGAVAEPDGSYAIAGLGAGGYIARVSPPDGLATVQSIAMSTSDTVVDLELAREGHLHGRVVDTDGRGVADAVVEVVRNDGDLATATDRDGGFELALTAGSYRVSAQSDDAQGEPQRVAVVAGERAQLELAIDVRSAELAGVVRDEAGAVADAVVVARPLADRPVEEVLAELRADAGLLRGRMALSDGDGRFALTVSRGPHVVLARRAGGDEAHATADPGREVALVLTAPRVVAGSIRSADGAAPARVLVRLVGDALGVRREDSFVLARGRFRFDAVQPGRYVISARASEGHGRAEIVVAGDRDPDPIAITLVPPQQRGARIIDLDSGDPIAGIYVAVGTVDEDTSALFTRALIAMESGDAARRTDDTGGIELTGAAGEAMRLMLLPGDHGRSSYEPVLVELPAGAGAVDVPLARRRLEPDTPAGALGLRLSVEARRFCRDTPVVLEPPPRGPLRKGDAIVTIAGHDVGGWRCYLAPALTSVAAGTTVVVSTGSGPDVELVAAAPPS